MRGTEPFDCDAQDVAQERAWAEALPVAVVRLGGVRAYRVVDDEGGPVLVVSDGVTVVEFGCGLAGATSRSAQGAQRLAEAMAEYAAALGAGVERS